MKRAGHGTVGASTFTDTTAALEAFWASHPFWVYVDIVDVTLLTLGYLGVNQRPLEFRWTTARYDVPFVSPEPDPVTGFYTSQVYAGGERYAGSPVTMSSPKLERGQLKHALGVEIDTLQLSIFLDGTDFLPPPDGNPATPVFALSAAIRGKLFEGAHVWLRRLFMPAHPTYPLKPANIDTSLGAVVLFGGQVTQSKVRRSTAKLSVKSYLVKGQIGMPRNVWQPQCLNTLYDTECGVDPTGVAPAGTLFPGTPFQATGTLTAMTTPTEWRFDFGATGIPAEWFTFGTMRFTTGVLAGLRIFLRRYVPDSLVDPLGTAFLLVAPPRVPTVGDTVLARAGCGKTKSECHLKFGNFINPGDTTQGLRFRGFPSVPPPETAI